MSDETEMVDVPWHDGTIRQVPLGSVVEVSDYDNKFLAYADEGGHQRSRADLGDGDPCDYKSVVVRRVFTEASEPERKLPTTPGATIYERDSDGDFTGWLAILTVNGWLSGYVYAIFAFNKVSENQVRAMTKDSEGYTYITVDPFGGDK